MDFKIGDKVKVISLTDTERRYKLDSFGYMETCLNKVFTVETIEGNGVYVEENGCVWSKYDLVLSNNNTLEIE